MTETAGVSPDATPLCAFTLARASILAAMFAPPTALLQARRSRSQSAGHYSFELTGEVTTNLAHCYLASFTGPYCLLTTLLETRHASRSLNSWFTWLRLRLRLTRMNCST